MSSAALDGVQLQAFNARCTIPFVFVTPVMPTEQEAFYPFIPMSEIRAIDPTLAEHISDWQYEALAQTKALRENTDNDALSLKEAINRTVDPQDWFARVSTDAIMPIFDVFVEYADYGIDFQPFDKSAVHTTGMGGVSGAGGQIVLLADYLIKAVVKAHIYLDLSESAAPDNAPGPVMFSEKDFDDG